MNKLLTLLFLFTLPLTAQKMIAPPGATCDPADASFYAPICEKLSLDFDRFKTLFESPEMKAATMSDFQLNPGWGVTGYPTVVFRKGDQMVAIARGYAEFEQMWEAVNQLSQE